MKLPLTLTVMKMINLTQIFSTIIDQTTKIFCTPHMVDNQANMDNIYQKTTPKDKRRKSLVNPI